MFAVSASIAAPARIASTRGLASKRPSAAAAPRRTALSVHAATSIQFVRGTNETSVPDVRLTRSKDGTNGTAFFTFSEPDVFEADELSGEITGGDDDASGAFALRAASRDRLVAMPDPRRARLCSRRDHGTHRSHPILHPPGSVACPGSVRR